MQVSEDTKGLLAYSDILAELGNLGDAGNRQSGSAVNSAGVRGLPPLNQLDKRRLPGPIPSNQANPVTRVALYGKVAKQPISTKFSSY